MNVTFKLYDTCAFHLPLLLFTCGNEAGAFTSEECDELYILTSAICDPKGHWGGPGNKTYSICVVPEALPILRAWEQGAQ